MGFLYKSYDHESVNTMKIEAASKVLTDFRLVVYIDILISALFACFGSYAHYYFNFGSMETAANVFLFVWWVVRCDPRKESLVMISLAGGSVCFGASVGPVLNFVGAVDARSIVLFFGCCTLVLVFHNFALWTYNIRGLLQVHFFSLPLLVLCVVFAHSMIFHGKFLTFEIGNNTITVIVFVVSVLVLWCLLFGIVRAIPWISGFSFLLPLHGQCLLLLSQAFHWNGFYIMCIYMAFLFGIYNLELHNFDVSNYVIDGKDTDLQCIMVVAFYTEFLGRSSSIMLFSGKNLVKFMWYVAGCKAYYKNIIKVLILISLGGVGVLFLEHLASSQGKVVNIV